MNKDFLFYIEQHIKDDNPLKVSNDRIIDYRNGYFIIMEDKDFPSHYTAVGGWDDFTHQKYKSIMDAFDASEKL